MRQYAHMRLRTNTFGAVFRIRHNMAIAIHKYFHEHGFYYFNTPLITASDAEGAGEMFQVTTLDLDRVAKSGKVEYDKDFFGKKTNLTVSGQLEGEPRSHGLRCHLHVWSYFPCREQQHAASLGRVLDDRTGGGLHGQGRTDGS